MNAERKEWKERRGCGLSFSIVVVVVNADVVVVVAFAVALDVRLSCHCEPWLKVFHVSHRNRSEETEPEMAHDPFGRKQRFVRSPGVVWKLQNGKRVCGRLDLVP